MEVKEHLIKELNALSNEQLNELQAYVSFLKFRSRFTFSVELDEEQITQLYEEFSEEDRLMAEEGMSEKAWCCESRNPCICG